MTQRVMKQELERLLQAVVSRDKHVSLREWLADSPSTLGISQELADLAISVIDSFDWEYHLAQDREQRPELAQAVEDSMEQVQWVGGIFEAWCSERGIVVLRRLQTGQRGADAQSWVYLCLDTDGIVKVFKELVLNDDEAELLQTLQNLEAFPRYFGVDEVAEGIRFLRMGVCYGQELTEFLGSDTCANAGWIVRELAVTMSELHSQGVLYLDLRPENVKINGDQVALLDLSASQRSEGPSVKTALFDSRYAAPEVVLEGHACKGTDVFQLGILWHQLLTGVHPFMVVETPVGADRMERVLIEALPCALLEPNVLPSQHSELISRMLSADHAARPSMSQIAAQVHSNGGVIEHPRRALKTPRKHNTVLFPARMGLPHKGHIEFIARLIELGYHVRVSIQRSYTITQDDPYPKWLIMKMVARSLMRRGFVPEEHFSFMLTPFYRTHRGHGTHFIMMPCADDVVEVASSNPGVQKMFLRLPMLDQRTVFGTEGEIYTDRSWGRRLRLAVKLGDRAVFDDLVACGVEDIRSFEELQSLYAQIPVEFVHGVVRAELVNGTGDVLVRPRVRRYETPETQLVRALASEGIQLRLEDPYSRDTLVTLDGVPHRLVWESMRMDGDDEIIRYRLEPNTQPPE